jgi:hypothetical protein
MRAVTIDDLKAICWPNIEHLGSRTVNLMPFWDGTDWHLWLPTADGLVEGKVTGVVVGDYVAKSPAEGSDLFIPFVHLMWQRASWPEICPLINAIGDRFHKMGTSVAKLRQFFQGRLDLPPSAPASFASTELEYVLVVTRSVFDLLQEIVSRIWNKRIQLIDHTAEARRRARALPETFSRIVLADKKRPKSAEQIENRYGLPYRLSTVYANIGPFFSQLRDARDNVVHGGQDIGLVYDTERGFCINPKIQPFSSFDCWRPEHYYNENIASVLPWIATVILQTIQACNALTEAFASAIQLPPEIAPGYRVFVRGPHNEILAETLQVPSGTSPWWG